MPSTMRSVQSRRTITRWQERYAEAEGQPVTLACLTYSDQQPEVAGKAMDFSPTSVRFRWDAGYRDGKKLVALLRSSTISVGGRGLQVHHLPDQQNAKAEHPG